MCEGKERDLISIYMYLPELSIYHYRVLMNLFTKHFFIWCPMYVHSIWSHITKRHVCA